MSTADQSCERQERDLAAVAARAGYEVVGTYKETASGVRLDRTERRKVLALAQRREIDAVLVTELSRWGRSTTDLLATLRELEARRVSLVALNGMAFDLSTPHGRMLATLLAGIAEFERELTVERIRSGITAAKARGKKLGRQPGQRPKSDRLAPKVLALVAQRRSYRLVGREVGLSKNTVAGIVKRQRAALLALLLFTAPALAVDAPHAEEPKTARADESSSLWSTQSMRDDQFWAVIDSTARFKDHLEQQVEALTSALRALSVKDVLAFEAAFGRQLKRAYSWDLWGAGYVIHGGLSDDGFEYFWRWLIAQGRTVFDQVIADPDSVANLLPPTPGGALDFEAFGYVARNVWGEKTGLPGSEIEGGGTDMLFIVPEPSGRYVVLEPSGTRFRKDPAYLAQRYPKLWQRFGADPLG